MRTPGAIIRSPTFQRSRKSRHWRHRLVVVAYRVMRWAQRRLPKGIRTLVGVAAMVGGVFGFLPVLGFWMLPLGVVLVVSDFPPLRRRMELWLNDTRRRYHLDLNVGRAAEPDPPSTRRDAP